MRPCFLLQLLKKRSDFRHSSLQVTVSQAIVFIFHLSECFLFSSVRKFCFHFTPHQLIWPFSAPVVCCLGYKALQYGIIVLYSFPSMQRRASFPWEEVGGSKLNISKYWFFPSLLLWEFSSKTKVLTCSSLCGSILLLSVSRWLKHILTAH